MSQLSQISHEIINLKPHVALILIPTLALKSQFIVFPISVVFA